MAKYCPNCGAPILKYDKFCLKCGINLKEKTPISFNPKTKKSNLKILGATVGVVIIIVIIAILIFLMLNGSNGIIGDTSDDTQDDDFNQSGNQNQNEDTSKFLGEWNIDFENYSGTIIIKSDNTLDVEYLGLIIEFGIWYMDDEEICLVVTQ